MEISDECYDFEPLLTADEIGKILRISRGQAYNLMRSGELPCLRIGKLMRVRKRDLSAFINQVSEPGK